MEPEPTIGAMAARAIILAASGHGLSPPDLCEKVGLDPAIVADVDGRVPASVMVALWAEVAKLDADFGLHLAETAMVQPALPWHLLRASATLEEGLLRLVAAWRVFNDIHPPEFVLPGPNSNEALLRMRTKGTPLVVPRHGAEFAFGWFVLAARRATGVDIRPLRVMFEHPKPANTAEHDRIFATEIVFDADATGIFFSKETLALPTADGGDRELVQLLERHAKSLLARLPPRGTFSSRVRAAMTPLLAGGDVTIERVASQLGSSPRSVQRKLHEEATSFQRMLDDLRKEVATAYLKDRVHSIAEIALLLGFSDQTAFHRAFVRWTGRTPGDVRRGVR
ncbi:MAG TPA: AraC family transcriptional regulator [Labilithrix sp.]|nr:AraC family transcriptional regulator [Labilithrix sp.]